MLGAVLYEAPSERLTLTDDVEVVRGGPREVVVKVAACGLCHSDLAAMSGSLWIPTPAVLGHEAAGVVESVGDEVTAVAPGDHVVIGVSLPCRACRYCVERRSPHLCERIFFDVAGEEHFRTPRHGLAAMGAIGGFAERVSVREEALVRIPDDFPLDHAALLSCGVMSGYGAVTHTAKVTPGSSVVVIGLGGVGAAAVQAARLAGASYVLVVDSNEAKQDAALRFGASAFCPPEALGSHTADATGDGFDYAFDVVGRTATMTAAFDATRRGGTTCIVGLGSASDTLVLRANDFYFQSKTVVGCFHGSSDFATDVPVCIDYARQGLLDLEGMITSRYALSDVNDAIDAHRQGQEIRTVVLPPA